MICKNRTTSVSNNFVNNSSDFNGIGLHNRNVLVLWRHVLLFAYLLKKETMHGGVDINELILQLERINLPKFSGSNYFYWKSFFGVTVLDMPWSD